MASTAAASPMAPDNKIKENCGVRGDNLPRIQRRKPSQLVVGKDDIENSVGDSREVGQCVNLTEHGGHATLAQRERRQTMVCKRVFEVEDAQRQLSFDGHHKRAIIGYKLEQTSVFAP